VLDKAEYLAFESTLNFYRIVSYRSQSIRLACGCDTGMLYAKTNQHYRAEDCRAIDME